MKVMKALAPILIPLAMKVSIAVLVNLGLDHEHATTVAMISKGLVSTVLRRWRERRRQDE